MRSVDSGLAGAGGNGPGATDVGANASNAAGIEPIEPNAADSGATARGAADWDAIEVTPTHPGETGVDPTPAPKGPRPGSLSFPLGSGVGQALLLLGVISVCALAAFISTDLALQTMVAFTVLCAVLRLTIPAQKVPALVNRGRGFDVGMFLTAAVAIEILVLTAPRL